MDVLQFASEQEASLWREERVATRSTKAADAAVLAYRARAQGRDKALANLYRAMLSVKSMAGAARAFRLGYVDRGQWQRGCKGSQRRRRDDPRGPACSIRNRSAEDPFSASSRRNGMPVALILQGKLAVGDPRRQQALDCGFKEQTIWTRPEDTLNVNEIESMLFKLRPYQFFGHEGKDGLLSVVLAASDECADRLVGVGFEAGTALTKWWGRQDPDEVREIAVITTFWGASNE